MEAAIEVRNISKSFGNLRALDEVSMQVERHTITILMGPNGSGKTTLINVIGGYYKPDSGKVLYLGKDITGLPPYKIYRLGLTRTFQIPALFSQLTVFENVMAAKKDNPGENFAKSLLRRTWLGKEREASEEAFKILELIGLSKMWDKQATVLSGGQMKLLEIGRALMTGANTIMLDEPISGVNPTLAHEIFSTLVKLRDNYGITFFIIEHRLDIALTYVDRVIAMAFGKFVTEGSPQDVTADRRVVDAYLGG
ncbi:MAG TPA: ABC transporter ATP-binding protein [Nitrososphaerales archaeon]|nr:ABC transporter ATP-binding protein [Nitrososphaerales archaeon]